MNTSVRLVKSALLEYFEYDSSTFRAAMGLGGLSAGALLWLRRDKTAAMQLLSRIHRSAAAPGYGVVERTIAELHRRTPREQMGGLWDVYRTHIRRSLERREAAAIVANPQALLGYRVLVVKGASPGERGVLVVDYSYVFPLFAALFDLQAISRHYHIVLEPSWRGLCTLDLLCYALFDFRKFVETVEPRDSEFLGHLGPEFVQVPTAANWWVDHRIVKPDPGIQRDIDVVMTASWSEVKRHWRFFRVLADLRRRGHHLKVALVGYPADKTRQDVEEEARHFGVLEQIEFHERLQLPEVVRVLARARVLVLWSRKEGANRAIIEGLFADVPVIAREGLGYGHRYPYVNPQTGRYATERDLGDALLATIRHRDQFTPRAWAIEHMSCQRATHVLEETIRRTVTADGEPWTRSLAVRTVQLETQHYWDPNDRVRFEPDYARIRSFIRHPRQREASA